jgi:hypothetical protein
VHTEEGLPGVRRVTGLVERYVRGNPRRRRIDPLLVEFTGRFNRRRALRPELLFHRLLERAVHTPPSTYDTIVRQRRRARAS